MPLLKPGRWAWNNADLDAWSQSVARGLRALIPFWDLGPPIGQADLITGNTPNNVVGGVWGWKAGPYGLELNQTDTSITNRVHVDYLTNLVDVNAGTILVVYRGNDTSDHGLVEIGSSASANYFIGIRQESSNDFFRYRESSTNHDVTLQTQDTDWHVAVASWDESGNVNAASDGIERTGTTRAGNAGTLNQVCLYNKAQKNFFSAPLTGRIALVGLWDRPLSEQERVRLSADPFSLLRRHTPVELYTPSTFTGTLAVTEAADSLAASGTVTAPTFTGTLAVTEQADSLAASGTFTPNYTGTLAVTENADGLVASGTFVPGPISGTLTLTEQADTLTASGSTATSTGRRQDGGLVASRQGGTMTVSRQEGGPV